MSAPEPVVLSPADVEYLRRHVAGVGDMSTPRESRVGEALVVVGFLEPLLFPDGGDPS